MKWFWWIVVAVTVGAQSALAESVPDTQANRRAAALIHLRVVSVRTMVDEMAVQISVQLPEDQREMFVELMTSALRWDVLERSMLASMVRHFTVREISALTEFQESAEGQSVMKKFAGYMADVMPTLQEELVRAVQQVESGNQ